MSECGAGGPLGLVHGLLLRPERWRRLTAAVEPALPADFCLLDLRPAHRHAAALRAALLHGYVLLPALVTAFGVGASLARGEPPGGIVPLAWVGAAALAFGLLISAAAGILIVAVGGTLTAVARTDAPPIAFDVLTGPDVGALFGICIGASIVAADHFAAPDRAFARHAFLYRLGAVLLGLAASALVMAVTVVSVFRLTVLLQSGELDGRAHLWLSATPATLFLAAAAALRGARPPVLLPFTLGAFAAIAAGTGNLGYEYDRGIGGEALLTALATMVLSSFLALVMLPHALIRRLVGERSAVLAGTAGGVAALLALEQTVSLFAFSTNLVALLVPVAAAAAFAPVWSALAYPFEALWNTLLHRVDTQRAAPGSLFDHHAVHWDRVQRLPFAELDDYLVTMLEADAATGTTTGAAALAAVDASRQRRAARAARAELHARRLESLPTVEALAEEADGRGAGELDAESDVLRRRFARVGGDVAAALSQPGVYHRRLVLEGVLRDLEALEQELLRGARGSAARRHVPVAMHWQRVVGEGLRRLHEALLSSGEIPNPYVVGVPLTRRQKLFVGRGDVARFVEDVLGRQGHPPLLLHGARRMGKTSLLYQLRWMLPRRVLPLVVDLQGPVALARDHAGFLYALARGIRIAAERHELALPVLDRETLAAEPFVAFDEWLDLAERAMRADGRDALLLALDEFEALDAALQRGTLDEHAVLGTLRHVVQHREGLKLMLAGSHTLAEFRRWSAYLVNAQVVEIGYLGQAETRQLIERPVADFPLRYTEAASARVAALTRGHPYLVQLVCAEIVALKNAGPAARRREVTTDDVDAALPLVLERGQQFFVDIELNQADAAGRAVLRWLAAAETTDASGTERTTSERIARHLPDVDVPATLEALARRDVIERVDGDWRFEVEAVRSWFASAYGSR